ncbi:MAG TPA: glucose-1-phosphate adenylyltransferase family protein [Pyrinomonadaceae bacterium]|nr:glucose-1-phosphate adenylyltransferase family protein [Pyrinomonadaceae bacterium]
MFPRKKILALILAGGAGGRLGLLTEKRAKPVMPFAGFYRLIDFALSNCLHSGIADVWVIEQYELHTLNEHLSNGRPWDLDRTYGGLQVLPPFERNEKKSDEKGGFAEGNADAIFRHLELIEEFNPDLLIVLSADHVYKFDFRDALQTHLEKKAALTMVTTRLPKGENASRFGVVETDADGRVLEFAYKPEKPQNDLITTEIFVYEAQILIETLKKLKETKDEIKDYGHELIPFLVKQGNVFEHRLEEYWRDVGTIKSYWQSQIDLLDERAKFIFDDANWRILTLAPQLVPAFIYGSADVKNSLVAHGCRVHGKVSRSILSSGVAVEKGAEVKDSIILPGATIEKGVKIERVIVDAGVKVTKEKLKKIEAARGRNKNAIVVVGKYKAQSEKEIED